MVQIEKIKVKELYAFACNILKNYSDKDVIPITKHRAFAYANNPCADNNDIGLLAAFIENRCVGYLGIMPGLLKMRDKLLKVYWFSTFFVAPELRGKGIGSALVKHALSLNYDFAVTAMAEVSERIFRKSGMQEFGPLEYYVMDLRALNPSNLPLRLLREIIRKFKIESEILNKIIKIADRIFLPLIKYAFYGLLTDFQKQHKRMIEDIGYAQVNRIEDDDFGETGNDIEFYRGAKIVNWMLEYSWVKEKDITEPEDLKYLFSEIRDVFKFIALRIYSLGDKNYKGFLVLSFSTLDSHSVLKVLDFQSGGHYEHIVFLALKYAIMHKANRIEFPDILIKHLRESLLLRLLTKKTKRAYLYYTKDQNSPLINLSDQIRLNYCDGDSAFF